MSLLDVLTAIDEGAGKPRAFAVIGAVARNAWAPPRATADLDLAVSAHREVLERIARRLESLGYRRVREQRADATDSLPDILAVGGHQSASGSGSAAWRRVLGVTGPVSKVQ